jgi:hypothetical protein
MNAIDLFDIVNKDVSVEIEKDTLIRLNYSGNILYVTFWRDNILMQKILACDSPQRLLEWSVDIDYYKLIYGLKKVDPTKANNFWFDLHFEPTTNKLVVNEANITVEINSSEKSFRHIPSLDFLNEKEPDSQTVFHHREWQKLYSTAHIARGTNADLLIESVGNDIYCYANSPTIRGLYTLTTQKSSSFNTFKLPFDLFDYLQSQKQHPNYVEISTYLDDEIVMVETGNTRFFFPYESLKSQSHGFIEIHKESIEIAIQKAALETALKVAIGNADIDCNEVYISLNSKETLAIEGKSKIKEVRLKKPVKTDKQSKTLLNASTLLDLLEVLEEDNLHLYLPGNRFEPFVIETKGVMIFCSGIYKPSRQTQQNYEQADTKVVYRRKQSDDTEFIVTAVEQSALAYLNQEVLSIEQEDLEYMREAGYSEDYANYYSQTSKLVNIYGHSMYIYKQARRTLKQSDIPIKGSIRQELRDRTKELVDAMAEATWYANPDTLDTQMNSSFEGKHLATETEKILIMQNDCYLKAGRVLEVLKELPKTYVLNMAVVTTAS